MSNGYNDPTFAKPGEAGSNIFWANSPTGGYGALETRRKIAEALLGKRSPYPKNIGEGIASIGESIGDVLAMKSLDERERQQALREDAMLRDMGLLPPSGAGTPAAATASGAPAGTQQASAPPAGDTGVPYVPSTPSGPGSVPLPPRRPVRDRSQQVGEVNEDPALMERFKATVAGEVTDPQERAIEAATVLNRARARGIPVAQALETYQGPGSRGYYPADALARGRRVLQDPQQRAAIDQTVTDVMRGADPSTPSLGFEATGNASNAPGNAVAANGIRAGRYPSYGQIRPGGETFVTQETPEQLARLTPFPRGGPDTDPGNTGPDVAQAPPGAPGSPRDAITAAMMSSTPLAQQQPFGGAPTAPAVPPPATPPPVQTAALGGTGGLTPGAGAPGAPGSLMAGAAPILPAGGFAPPGPGPTAALPPPAAAGPPPAQPGNPPIVMDNLKTAQAQPVAPGTLPSRSPMLPDVPLELPEHPGAAPKPPPIPQPTDKMRQLSYIISSGSFSPGTKEAAKIQLGTLKDQQKQQFEQDVNQYHFDRADWDKKDEARKKAVREAPLQAIDRRIKLLSIERDSANEAERPDRAAHLQAQINNERINYAKTYQEIYKQPTTQIGGALYRETPAVPEVPGSGLPSRPAGPLTLVPGSPPPTLTSEQAKAVTFVRDVLPDMELLKTKLNNGLILATSPGSSLGSTLGGKVGLQNVLVSKEYQQAENAIGRFKGAVMQHLSGAAVSVSEAERNLPAFIPRYGDSPEEVELKARRRENYVNAVAATAGQGGDAIEQGRRLVMQANAELPPVKVNSLDELKKLGAGQRVILPDGSPGQVPWPKHLLPK